MCFQVASRGCRGLVGVAGVYLGAGKMCRYSRGQKGYRWHNETLGAPRGCWANSDITVASSLKSYPKKWCHTPTLSLEIHKTFNIFYFY